MAKNRKPLTARVISTKTSFRGRVFSVACEIVKEPAGFTALREIVRHPGSVVIMAIRETRGEVAVLLERQYRHAAAGYLWELPAGKIDPGEKPLPAARRELLEETGYTATLWKKALYFYVSPGFLDETMTVFLARGLQKGKAHPEADEAITARFFSLPVVLRMAENGSIYDAKTIASLFWLARQRLR
jgi:ADP-ribose pyrophosphatase